MSINTSNYELYFVNYYDGSLKPEEIDMLMAFLKEHPALEDEFFAYGQFQMPPSKNITLEDKSFLKKSVGDKQNISESNIQEFLIAYIEKELSAFDTERLMAWLEVNPSYKKDLELYKKSILEPEMNIVFEGKNTLKKKVVPKVRRINYFWYSAIAAAACVLLILNVFLNDNKGNKYGLKMNPKDNFLQAGLFNRTAETKPKDTIQIQDIKINNRKFKSDVFIRETNTYQKMNVKGPVSLASAQELNNISDVREEYSSLYSYIKASEYDVEEATYADIMPEKPRESFLKYAADKLLNNNSTEEKKMDVWQIVDIGTYGINKLANTDIIDIKRTRSDKTVKTDFALGGNVIYSNSKTIEKK